MLHRVCRTAARPLPAIHYRHTINFKAQRCLIDHTAMHYHWLDRPKVTFVFVALLVALFRSLLFAALSQFVTFFECREVQNASASDRRSLAAITGRLRTKENSGSRPGEQPV